MHISRGEWCVSEDVFLVMVIIFVVSWFLGSLATLYLVMFAPNELQTVNDMIKQAYGDIPIEFYSIDTAFYIFRRNLLVAAISTASGLLVFIPGAIVFANGFIVGMVIMLVIMTEGSPLLGFVAIAPHGVFELPAILMASAFGTKLGIDFWKYVFKRNREDIAKTLKILPKIILIIVLLLLVASLIESFITPYIVSRLID
ncbi:MAG: stage II sporulation protein M [Ignisphaera sp.]